MPKVNLVPAEEQRREFQRQLYIFPIAGAILVIGALGGSYYYFNNKLNSVQQDLDLYKQNNANLAKQVAELQKYEDLKKDKQSRLNAVTSAYQSRFRWSRLLDDVSFVIPETISLIKIDGRVPGATQTDTKNGASAKDTASQRDLEFEGYTYSMPDVAIFMVRLSLIPSLTDVTLKLAEVEEVGTQRPVHFTINASLKNVGETQRPAVAPTTGEEGPSDGTATTGTSTSPTTATGTATGGRTSTVGTGTTR